MKVSLRSGLLSIAMTVALHCSTPTPANDAGSESGIADVVTVDGSALGRPHCTVNNSPAVDYPPGPYGINDETILPNLALSDGTAEMLQLKRYFTPCATEPKVLMIRVLAAWSGPSIWHAQHTTRVLRPAPARTDVLDMLVLGRDNLPSTARDLTQWRAMYPAPVSHSIVMDPEYQFRTVFFGGLKQLPIVVLVDPRVMRVMTIMVAPEQQDLDLAVLRSIAQMDGAPRPRPGPPLGEHELSEDQLDMLRDMARVVPPPASPTNRFADDPRAAELGNRLFRDSRLSSGTISCASCHEAINSFTDRRAHGVGIDSQMGGRNTPTIQFVAYTRWAFWDGRMDSAWSQALGPIENPIEMRGSRLRAAHVLYDFYRTEYEAIFGPMPPLSDVMRFAANGMPGQPGFDSMSDADKIAINRVYANLGKSIDAYERTVRFMPNALDRFVGGETGALTAQQQAGLHHYFHNGCIQCHHGPMMTNDSFHNIGMPTGRADGMADPGRIEAIAQVLANPFNAGGMFSDQPTDNAHLIGLVPTERMRGMFHTPGLRGISRTGPWGHGGTFTRMEDVIKHYGSDALRNMVMPRVGEEDLHLGNFHIDDATVPDLVALMNAL